MFCKNCGNQLPDGSAFCNKCGTSLVSNTNQPVNPAVVPATAPEKKKSNAGVAVAVSICAAVVAVAVTAIIFLFNGSNQPEITPNHSGVLKPSTSSSENVAAPGSATAKPAENAPQSNTVTLTVNVNIEENKKLAKYDVDFSIGDKRFATIKNGGSYTTTVTVEKGSYDFVFEKNGSGKTENEAGGFFDTIIGLGAAGIDKIVGKAEITAKKTVDITKDTTLNFTIHTNERTIEIK